MATRSVAKSVVEQTCTCLYPMERCLEKQSQSFVSCNLIFYSFLNLAIQCTRFSKLVEISHANTECSLVKQRVAENMLQDMQMCISDSVQSAKKKTCSAAPSKCC